MNEVSSAITSFPPFTCMWDQPHFTAPHHVAKDSTQILTWGCCSCCFCSHDNSSDSVHPTRSEPVDIRQGMTIRTARLPGAGNLLSRAGEDLSGLPDWASRYRFFKFFIDSIFQFKHQISSHCDSFCFVVPQSQHQFPFTSSNRQTSVLQHVIGLPVQLSQSEASSLYSWRSMARTQLALV